MVFTVGEEGTGRSVQILWVYTAGRCRQVICPHSLWKPVKNMKGVLKTECLLVIEFTRVCIL